MDKKFSPLLLLRSFKPSGTRGISGDRKNIISERTTNAARPKAAMAFPWNERIEVMLLRTEKERKES